MNTSEPVRLTRGQWMVLLAAFLGWLFDGFEIGLFPVVARPALLSMLPEGGDKAVAHWMGIVTACFLLGAAVGGVIFGWLGDKVGRVRALSFSILTYSLFTGFGYLAQEPWHLGFFRFIAALGMGGEWALGVALVMECWPEKRRPLLAGAIGAAANCGFFLVAGVAKAFPVTQGSWRFMFLVGAAPAILVFIIRLFVPESERWKKSVEAASEKTKPVREVLGSKLLPRTLLGIALASVALIGTWGSVQWLPIWADQMAGAGNPGAKATTQMYSAFGAVIGSLFAPLLGARFGRRPAYAFLCLMSLFACGYMFRGVHTYGPTFLLMTFLIGATTASFYGWFPLYLPELFPTRVRATGQGLCYNFGRVFAAVGALTQAKLVGFFETAAKESGTSSYAQAGAVITLIYLIGLLVVWLGPETKGKPLPE